MYENERFLSRVRTVPVGKLFVDRISLLVHSFIRNGCPYRLPRDFRFRASCAEDSR